MAGAADLLVGLGMLQILVGLLWLARPRSFRDLVKRRPGVLVACTAVPAVLIAALGGSSTDTSWVTSVEALLIATGAVLRLRGIVAIVALGTLVAGSIWQLTGGDTGGYGNDGDYLVATVALAKSLIVGLWLGRVTGDTWRLLGRWLVVERSERGVVELLRQQLLRVDAAAAAVGARLARAPAAAHELRILRARLGRGVDARAGSDPVTTGSLLADLALEHRDAELSTRLVLDIPPAVAATALAPSQAAATLAAVRRQLDNVARHAPAATLIELRAARDETELRLTITDDGGGRAPVAAGAGTGWSGRQLDRFRGTLRYFDAPQGVGVEICVPLTPRAHLTSVRRLSLAAGMDRFAAGMLGALRLAGYVGDSLAATGIAGIGMHWIWMPIGAAVIEFVIWRGVPGFRMTDDARRIAASALAIALTCLYTLPAGSPDELVPASTSVIVVATLLLSRQGAWWLAFELARALAVLPLVLRTGQSVVAIVVIYPVAFNLLVFALGRFIERARGLERLTLDAFGRAALSSATLHSLALRHDVVDVLLRNGPTDDGLAHDAARLEDAVDELRQLAAESLDPRAIVHAGVEASLGIPVAVRDMGWAPPLPLSSGAAAIDRITLSEIAALAADERASCAPPGIFGRRRLRSVELEWRPRGDGATELRMTSAPVLRDPDHATLHALEQVAATVGVRIESARDVLRIVFLPTT